jgi:SSS family transporter
MAFIDWVILSTTLLAIISYGVYRSGASKNLDGYFRGNKQLPWYLVLLGIMGTQASAITFISGPGQAYNDGMRFVQYYFGLPLAMIVIAVVFLPIFHKLNVYTAYEYLEKRFDKRTRSFAAIIFLLGRGLSTGISIVAPSIVLSTLLGWNVNITNLIMGGIVIFYTVSGGAKAVAYTQQLQFVVIIVAMVLAGYYAVHYLPAGLGFSEAVQYAKDAGKMNIVTTGIKADGSYNWNDKFNIYSGIIGGFFLALSYFGTDQSQVGRYISAKTVKESRRGLLWNGLLKVPMQFLILLVGILVFVFYQYNPSSINYNNEAVQRFFSSEKGDSAKKLAAQYQQQQQQLLSHINNGTKDSIQYYQQKITSTKKNFSALASRTKAKIDVDDTNYVFMHFVVTHLPKGVIGLLVAMIFLAAWGSIAAALNSLASSSIIDLHKQYTTAYLSELREYKLSKWYTLGWGLFCIAAAQFATSMGSLIVAVNVLGSIFYGVMLGLFLVAFFLKFIKAKAVFWAAVISQLIIFYIYFILKFEGFLWLNVIGAALVVGIAVVVQLFIKSSYSKT